MTFRFLVHSTVHTKRIFLMLKIIEKSFSEALELSKSKLDSQFHQLQSQNNQHKESTRDLIESVKEELADRILRVQSDCGIPLSVCFSAHKDEDYQGKGEENLRFSGCSVNVDNVLDTKSVEIQKLFQLFEIFY